MRIRAGGAPCPQETLLIDDWVLATLGGHDKVAALLRALADVLVEREPSPEPSGEETQRTQPPPMPRRPRRKKLAREEVAAALDAAWGSAKGAARTLGIPAGTFTRWVLKYRLREDKTIVSSYTPNHPDRAKPTPTRTTPTRNVGGKDRATPK